MENQDIIQKLKNGGVGVLPSDTIYGLMCKALDQKAVERVYQIKGRSPDKPCIILISSLEDLTLFNINPDQQTKSYLEDLWPNPVSIILPCLDDKFVYLHRGTKTLAFRMPDNEELRNMLQETGPIIAPSANPESFPVARNINQAKKYFNDKVDFYIDGGDLVAEPSTLVKITGGKIEVLRQGSFNIWTKSKDLKN